MADQNLDQLIEFYNRLLETPFGRQMIDSQREASGFARTQLAQQRELAIAGLDERAASSRLAAQTSRANSRDSVNAQLKAAKMNHEARMRELEQIGIPRLELERIDTMGRLDIARQAQALQAAQIYTQMQSTPSNWAEAANLARNVDAAGVPVAFRSLTDGANPLAAFSPTARAAGTLAEAGVGGGAGQAQGDDLAALRTKIGNNPGQVPLGALESMTGTERSMLGSLLKSGPGGGTYDMPTWLDNWRRSRPGQGDPMAA